MALQFEVRHHDSVSLVRVLGNVDERFDGAALAAELAGRTTPIVFDLDAVKRITSFGVRQWLECMRAVATELVSFARCRPSMIAQLNTVPRFGGRAQLVSLYCPFVCARCDHSFEVLLDVRHARATLAARRAPPASCPRCGQQAEIDELEDTYFAWAAGALPSSLPPAVEAAVDGALERPQLAPFRIEKHVEGSLTAVWLSGVLDGAARVRRYLEGAEGLLLILLGDVELATPEGLARLTRALEVAPGALLARVPAPLAAWAVEAPARVVSVELRATCNRCRCARAVDVTEWWSGPPTGGADCPLCGEALAFDWTPEMTRAMARLPIALCPDEAAAYLSAHPESHQARAAAGPGARIGKYEIVRRLGQGGMAEVLLGRYLGPEGFEKRVVVKRILPHLAARPRFVTMFTQEARLAARLQHAHVVQVLDLGRDQDAFFIVMEYVAGIDLHALLKLAMRAGELLPVDVCARIAADVCGALHAAHSFVDDDGRPGPIVHRDVSPQNILLADDGRAKLTDFGIAKAADTVSLTASGMVRGKVLYMAPELLDAKPASSRTDTYAAGLVLYEMLTLRHPFRGHGEQEILQAVLERPVPPVSAAREGLPPGLVDVVARATRREPKGRFPSARDMQLELERYASPTPAVASWLESFVSRTRRG